MSEKQPETTKSEADTTTPAAAPAAPETDERGSSVPPQDNYDDDNADSLYGDDGASSTASLTASILNYRTVHGRTYHSSQGDAEYWYVFGNPPRRPGIHGRRRLLTFFSSHHVLTLLLDGELCRAPISDNVQKVLDVGTGTGLWAIDFGDKYPTAEVIGTDLSPIQPGWVPPNVMFQIDDCTQEWTFEANSFDFVHMRWLFGSIKDWDELYAQAYRALKPGGWIESHEASVIFHSDDGSVNDKTAMGKFGQFFIDGGKKMGRSMTIVEDGIQRKGIEAAGFVNIHEEDIKSPFGDWPKDPKMKEIGSFQRLATSNDTAGSMHYMGNLLGWSPEEVIVYAANLRREFRSPHIHAYYMQKIVWAQKPE
ncbi:Demethylmenaquinone methyltransferase [Madurella mycetomatis]|uniref:Demethylmenaquinone methyltransferase n=1 Tax=Madurella mycetomatis TaxID=100816 RepID=A0A175VRC5_9PEZI|nr:Demethylmenaquinone methyltransferase [Madurella mycetomatis]